MSDAVEIQINMGTGDINIKAPADALDRIFDRLETLLPKLIKVYHTEDAFSFWDNDEDAVYDTL